MKYQLNLDYSISLGALSPYFEALHEGKALASACSKCGFVAFPARIQCAACGGSEITWKPLKGRAEILFRTDGVNSSFALVKFDEADTCSTVGLINPERKTTVGALAACVGEAPGLWLQLADEK